MSLVASFQYILTVIYTTTLLSYAQLKLCVWNSEDTFAHYNGEYLLSSRTHLNYRYWVQTSGACNAKYYIQRVDTDMWMIFDTLQSSYVRLQPYCDIGTKSNPTQCTQWISYKNPAKQYNLPINVYDGECPSLKCSTIYLSNTGSDECDTEFVHYNHMDNIYANGAIYLYFNEHTFKWYCSKTLGVNDCDADIISDYYVSSLAAYIDIDVGKTATLVLENGMQSQWFCEEATTSTSPSIHPTNSLLSKPQKNPSHAPIYDPVYTTLDPTINDPLDISLDPSSAQQTLYPVYITLDPTNNPLNMQLDPTNAPTMDEIICTTCHPTEDTHDSIRTSLYYETFTAKHEMRNILIYVIGSCVLLLIVGILCVCICYHYKKREAKYNHAVELTTTAYDIQSREGITATDTVTKGATHKTADSLYMAGEKKTIGSDIDNNGEKIILRANAGSVAVDTDSDSDSGESSSNNCDAMYLKPQKSTNEQEGEELNDVTYVTTHRKN